MAPKCASFLALVLIATPCGAAPTIIGNSSDARCVETWKMAQAAFQSDRSSLLWPVVKPIRQTTRVILSQALEDISGGGGVDASGDFDVVGGSQGQPTLFWRRGKQRALHLVIVDTPFNWQGDWYATYLLPSDTTAGELLKRLTADTSNKPLTPLLGVSRWAIPLVLTDQKTGQDWIIDRGEPYETLADWKVYQPIGLNLNILCRVSFGLPKEGGLSLLPPAVARFAAAADEALGPGNNEGTLQSTAGLRLAVKQDWATAALRPWAITDAPYNTRAEINRGLDKWASGNRRRLAVRARIRRNEINARGPLAAYYVTHFGKTPAEARRLSQRILDHNFRAYFTFPKSG